MSAVKSKQARVSVIIPHLNQPADLALCLESLASGSLQPEEIIVVDNGSSELPRSICAAHKKVRLIVEPVPGPGPARNTGVDQAKGEILAFIDADCRADEDWISVISEVFGDPAAEILGGYVGIACVDPRRPTLLEAYESIYGYRMDHYIAREGFTGTGNLAVRRNVWEAVGPFRGLDVAEDRDWGQRATSMGHSLRYVPRMKVYHPARKTFSELATKWNRHVAHDFAAGTERPLWRLRWSARMLAILLSPPAELFRTMATRRVTGLRARCLAWVGVTRVRIYRAHVMARLLLRKDAAHLTERWNRG